MAEEIIKEDNPEEEDTQKGKYMTFKSGHEYFGIEIRYINEIIGMQSITAIPEVEPYIKGLINLRGKIIPVIDVRIRFNQEPFQYTDRTCIIIINVKSTVVGLIVETIAGWNKSTNRILNRRQPYQQAARKINMYMDWEKRGIL